MKTLLPVMVESCGAFFALSVGIDATDILEKILLKASELYYTNKEFNDIMFMGQHISDYSYYIEDGMKLLGIIGWFMCLGVICYNSILKLYAANVSK